MTATLWGCLLPHTACRRQIVLAHRFMMNSSTKPNVNVPTSSIFYQSFTMRRRRPNFVFIVDFSDETPAGRKTGMRELSCVIVPNSRGWLLIVGAQRRGWFPTRDAALRAAIVEAQRGRTAGFYSSVKVRSVTSSSGMRKEPT